jgi:hypothetical protein
MGLKEKHFFEGAERLGLPFQAGKDITQIGFRPQQNAILQPRGTAGRTSDVSRLRFPEAFGCTFCGHCSQGCFEPLGAPINLKAKRSTSVSYIPMALTADRWSRHGKPVTLMADAFAIKVGLDPFAAARRLTWRVGATGEVFTEDARVIVLACGTVETPRLWLNSGLPNPNAWVGRGLTDHFVDAVTGLMPFDTGSSRGPGSGARIDYPGRGMIEPVGETPGLRAALSAFSDAGIPGYYNNGMSAGGADITGRLVTCVRVGLPDFLHARGDLGRIDRGHDAAGTERPQSLERGGVLRRHEKPSPARGEFTQQLRLELVRCLGDHEAEIDRRRSDHIARPRRPIRELDRVAGRHQHTRKLGSRGRLPRHDQNRPPGVRAWPNSLPTPHDRSSARAV